MRQVIIRHALIGAFIGALVPTVSAAFPQYHMPLLLVVVVAVIMLAPEKGRARNERQLFVGIVSFAVVYIVTHVSIIVAAVIAAALKIPGLSF